MLEFHYNLSFPGNWGLWLMGLVAIFWVGDCIVSLLLTFPRGRPFFNKWWPAWKIKRQRLNHDVHCASGLWLVAVVAVATGGSEQCGDELARAGVQASRFAVLPGGAECV